MIALMIVGFAVVGSGLYFSFHRLKQDEDDMVISPATREFTRRPAASPPSAETAILQSVVESSPVAATPESEAVPEATPGIDVAPPVGSEASVPAVFGLLAQSNVTNLPIAEGLQGIAEEFTEKVKQGGWDTTSEAYRTNWEKAAQEADDTLRARYGTEIYLNLKQNAAP
jgi:hypothetical protein